MEIVNIKIFLISKIYNLNNIKTIKLLNKG